LALLIVVVYIISYCDFFKERFSEPKKNIIIIVKTNTIKTKLLRIKQLKLSSRKSRKGFKIIAIKAKTKSRTIMTTTIYY
jgi:hypothetical protein